jgi:hypothetical protein
MSLLLLPCHMSVMSWGSSVDIVTRLFAGQSELAILAGERQFGLLQNVQNGSEVHPVAGVLARGVKQPKRDTDNSPFSIAEVKNECNYSTVPPVCFHVVSRDNLTRYCPYTESKHGKC